MTPEATVYRRQHVFAANVRRYDVIMEDPLVEVWDIATALDEDESTVMLVTPRGDAGATIAYRGGVDILRPDDPPED